MIKNISQRKYLALKIIFDQIVLVIKTVNEL